MSAPRRWLDDADVPGNERELLRAGLVMDPPPDAQGAVWAALLTKVPPPPPSPPSGTGTGTGAGPGAASKAAGAAKAGASAAAGGVAVGAGILKSVLIGAGSAVALIATYTVVTPSFSDAPPRTVATVAPQSALPEPARAVPGAGALGEASKPEPGLTASSAPGASSASTPADRRAPSELQPAPARASTSAAPAASNEPGAVTPPADRDTLLREESRLLGEARDALRDGDATRALGLLEQLRARFPGGMLAQEREALTIEALARSGRRGDAAVRAAAFLRAYPASPLGARVQTFAN